MQPQKKFTYWHLIFFNYVLFFYRLLSTISNVSMAGSPATWVLVCFTKYWTETWQFQLPARLHPAITALKLGSSFIKYKLSSDQVFPNEDFFFISYGIINWSSFILHFMTKTSGKKWDQSHNLLHSRLSWQPSGSEGRKRLVKTLSLTDDSISPLARYTTTTGHHAPLPTVGKLNHCPGNGPSLVMVISVSDN